MCETFLGPLNSAKAFVISAWTTLVVDGIDALIGDRARATAASDAQCEERAMELKAKSPAPWQL